MFGFQIVAFDVIRVVAFGAISGTYTTLGSVVNHTMRVMCVTNTTDADMYVSDDGINNKLVIPASSFKLFDLATNHPSGTNEAFQLPQNGQFYVKQVGGSPTKGAVYLEFLYAVGE